MNFLETLKNWWKDAPSVARATVATGVGALVLFGLLFATTSPTHNWAALNSQPLGIREVSAITEALDAKGIPYELKKEAGGQIVAVPRERLSEVRIGLAKDKVFVDETADPYEPVFGEGGGFMTASKEHLQQLVARQRSIEMQLMSLEPVKRARVNIAESKPSILEHNTREPKATVVIELEKGFGFTKELAASIQDSVAHAVNGLAPEKVVVVDTLGRRVGLATGDAATALASRTLALRQEQESLYEARIVQLLEPIVGYGRVVARVSARMDMSRVEQRSEEFDPDNAVVRHERKSTDNASTEDRGPARAAGVGGNAPQRPAGDPDGPSSRTKNENSIHETDYAVPRKVTESSRPMGTIERLSVAVVIDSHVMEPPSDEPPAEDGETKEAPVDVEVKARRAAPIPSERALAEIVKKAVGFDPVRGDQVEVLYAPFNRPSLDTEALALAPSDKLSYESVPPWIPFSAVVFVGFALVAFAMFRTEKARKLRAAEEKRLAEEEKARIEAEEKEAAEKATETLGQVPIKEEVRRLATANLQATSQVMKEWLSVMGTRST